jgi:hypothetical protein
MAATQKGLVSFELVTVCSPSFPDLFIFHGTGVSGVKAESGLILRRDWSWCNPANSGRVGQLNALSLIQN